MHLALFMLLSILSNEPGNNDAGNIQEQPEQVYCPVLPDEEVDPSIYTDFNGKRVYFCCQKCRGSFLQDPTPYLAKLDAEAEGQEDEKAANPLQSHDHGDGTNGQAGESHLEEGDPHVAASAQHEHNHETDHEEPAETGRVIGFAGKFHPLAVHFPIAIILAAALAEMLNLRLKRPIFSLSARYLVILGALSALGTAGLGWAAGAYAHFPGELAATLVWHRWLGTAAAATAVLAGIFSGLRSRYQNSAAMCRLYLVSLFASAALVGLAGHLGAMLVYGWQHFTW